MAFDKGPVEMLVTGTSELLEMAAQLRTIAVVWSQAKLNTTAACDMLTLQHDYYRDEDDPNTVVKAFGTAEDDSVVLKVRPVRTQLVITVVHKDG